APWEKYDSALVGIGRAALKSLGAGICKIHLIQIEKWSRARTVDPGRIERLRAKTDGAVRYGSAHRHAVQICGRSSSAVEINHVARLGRRNVNAEHGGILHAPQADDCS